MHFFNSRRLENLVVKHMKMEKTPRYTQRERNMVLSYAAQYKDIIENKRTDAESNRKKDEVWRQIAKDFNARVYHQRSSKQLRQLYKNMKLLLKKDLCGEGKCNRTFIDLLNTISQQESVSQYIAEQMSPTSFNNHNHNNNNNNDNSAANNNNNTNIINQNNNNNDNNSNKNHNNRQKKCDNEYDDSKHTLFNYNEAMDSDVIVIKSEDMTDNEQSAHEMDDDDDCMSPQGIPEVCLEEEDEELFATDLRQQRNNRRESQQMQFLAKSSLNQQMQAQQDQQAPQNQQMLESNPTIQGIGGGGIRVGSIGSMANMKALQTTSNASNLYGNDSTLNLSANTNGGSEALNLRHSSAEQRFLLNGLGLSAVHSAPAPLPATSLASLTLPISMPPSSPLTNNLSMQKNEKAGQNSPQNSSDLISNSANSLAHQMLLNVNNAIGRYNAVARNNNCMPQTVTNRSMSSRNLHKAAQNDYFVLGIEERKLKIELLNAQIDYWKKLTSKLDENPCNSPNPSCACHFPGKYSLNRLSVPTTNAS